MKPKPGPRKPSQLTPPQTHVPAGPAIQLANFAYVPLRYRVVVVSVASFFWSVFVSYATHA